MHSHNTYTDTELLQQYRKTADSQWLGSLFERYSLLVFGVCMKYLRNATDAQDATQHVFEKALGEVGKYEIPFFKSWIYSVAKNHCLMQLRRGLQNLAPQMNYLKKPVPTCRQTRS